MTINESAHTVTVTVPYATNLASLNPTVVTTGAAYSPTGAQNFTNSAATPLVYTVTAANSSTQDYSVSVTKTAGSSNADLSALTLSTGSLSPAFSAGTTEYTVSVPYTTSSIAVTGTKADANATLTDPVLLGSLPPGLPQTATVTVTAESGDVKAYQVVVTRCATVWARTITAGTPAAQFNGVGRDSTGNVYAVGYLVGTEAFGFGSSVTAQGMYENGYNPVIVKYDSSGTPLWARTVTAGTNAAEFTSVSLDSAGNAYAVGYIKGTSAFGFGNSVTAQGTCSTNNVVIVKYDSSGTPLWARTIIAGTNESRFDSICLDGSANAYVVGYIYGREQVDFGDSVKATGTAMYFNPVIVKYDASGKALWAKTLTAGQSMAAFNGVSLDSTGNAYAVGYIYATETWDFGGTATAQGTRLEDYNPVIVKYDSNGNGLWARSSTSGTTRSQFLGVSLDGSGNAYAVGFISGSGAIGFGNSVTAQGASTNTNPVIVKYDSSGTALWAKTLTSGLSAQFKAVSVDGSGRPCAVGFISGTGAYGFGGSFTAQGASTNTNPVIVRYDSGGTPLWASSIAAGTMAEFLGISLDSAGNAWAVGNQVGTEAYGFGGTVTAQGTALNSNPLIVKYAAQ